LEDRRGWDDWRQWRGPSFRLDAIGEAWTWIMREAGVWPIAALLYWLISVAASMPFSLPSLLERPRMPRPGAGLWEFMPWNQHSPALVILNYGGGIAVAIFLYPLLAGIMFAALRRLRGEQIDVGRIFELRGRYWALAATGAIVLSITYVAFAACILPVLFVAPLFMLAPLLVLDRGLGPWEAIQLSAKTVGDHYWSAFGFYIVVGLASALGVFACCIGLVFTIPIQWLACAIVYNEFFPPTRPEVIGFQA
jgi:hypothetical protein